MIAAAEIGIEACRQHFRKHAGHVATTMHPAHETGVRIAGGVRKDVTHELVMHDGQIGGSGWHRLVEAGTHAIGNRLPDRAVANVLDVVENIVEHPVPLGTGAWPVHRVQIAAGN